MSIHLPSPPALPRHRRAGRPFEDLLGAPAADVLASMDAAGDDVPNQAPAHPVALDAVGVRRRDVVISIEDPFGGDDAINAICRVDVSASVPATRRGVHLSRIGHLVAESVTGTYAGLLAYAARLAEAVAASQYGGATVSVRGRIPYLEEVHTDRGGRRKSSLEHLEPIARSAIESGRAVSAIGLSVTHLVACPCVQNTYRHTLALRQRREIEPTPLMTHSQRCVTTLVVHGVRELRSFADMLARLDDVLIRTCNTLPRDAELALVYRAHRDPQFIEDALRAAAVSLAGLWSSAGSFDRIVGRSRSLESIHGHDLAASLTMTGLDRHTLDAGEA